MRLAYGHALRTAGRTDEAIAAYRNAAEIRAGCGEAWFCLANLKTFRFTRYRHRRHARAGGAGGHRRQRSRCSSSSRSARHSRTAADFPGSFAHYARGNALRRRAVRYDADRQTRLVERTRALYTQEFFAARAGAGCTAADPIFIVGLPRSGSTLLEQILASHSQVEGTRELPDIPGFALELGALSGPGQPPAYPDSVARLTRGGARSARAAAIFEQTRPNRVRGTPCFVDKMPSNFCHPASSI